MEVRVARVSGFCGNDGQFGVSGAIRLAHEAALSDPGKVYLIGELVHNQDVTNWLQESYQIKVVKSLAEVPAKAIVVVKAHGAPPAFFAAAAEKKLRLVDATCPMVKASQNLIKQLVAAGKEVLYVASDKKHDEAISVSQQVEKGVKVITLAQLPNLKIKHPEDTVVLTQTTLSILETADKFAQLQKLYPQLTIRPHLCQATTLRQRAVLELAQEVDILIVVGSPHSSNSQRLKEVAESTGKPAYAVSHADEINPDWFDSHLTRLVGVIAGASTPAWVTQAVIQHLQGMDL